MILMHKLRDVRVNMMFIKLLENIHPSIEQEVW